MAFQPTALAGLFPVLAAGSLILRGLSRRRAKTTARRAERPAQGNLATLIQMPKDVPPPPRRAVRPQSGADARPCPACGNTLEADEALCLPCRRKAPIVVEEERHSRRETAVHWLVFAGGVAAIGALGWLIA
ncbi:hypothetical protein V8J36_11635 [Frigidibacter sp. MR17.14]|uniref:hypothetical protein n=1 Tax=Frigidibacter sp. MR17.14 TaxID=3126509 RepID=UPI003012A3FF